MKKMFQHKVLNVLPIIFQIIQKEKKKMKGCYLVMDAMSQPKM